METPIYLDSNIWIDFWEDRRDNIRPLGEFAFQLLKKTYECKYRIIVSTLVIKELEIKYSRERVKEITKELMESGKHELLEVYESDKLKAEVIAEERGTEYNDTLHAVLANRAHAKYLITRNLRHFENLSDLAEAVLPENSP